MLFDYELTTRNRDHLVKRSNSGLQVHLEAGKLQIDQEGRSRKFTKKVQQKTFAGSSANGRAIMYVTERAVFRLVEGKGLELVEIAPGICTGTKTRGLSWIVLATVTVCEAKEKLC